jgi:membrane protein implicated in regulation of membrane protease activity
MEPVNNRIFLKYLLLQVPGWLLVVLLLRILSSQVQLPGWAGPTLVGLWIVKDLALYPLLRRAYEDDPRTGAERLVGSSGITVTPLAPQGYIRVRGELWQAKVLASSEPVPKGARVRILAARNLTLAVERD